MLNKKTGTFVLWIFLFLWIATETTFWSVGVAVGFMIPEFEMIITAKTFFLMFLHGVRYGASLVVFIIISKEMRKKWF